MIRITLVLWVCISLQTPKVAAQDSLRIASWNIENFNKYKAEVTNYIDMTTAGNKDLYLPSLLYPESAPTVTAGAKLPGHVINDFMNENKIDLLFIQEFVPFSVVPASGQEIVFEYFKEIKGISPTDFDVYKCSYYDETYFAELANLEKYDFKSKKKGFLVNDNTVVKYNGPNDQLMSTKTGNGKFYDLVDRSGEGYVVVVRKNKNDFLFEQLANTFTGNKFTTVRPPVQTSFSLVKKNVAGYKLINGKIPFVLFNYHAQSKETGNSRFDFTNDILAKNQDWNRKGEFVLFLGDFNSDCSICLPKVGSQANYTDQIYVNDTLKSISRKITTITKNSTSQLFKDEKFYPEFSPLKFSKGKITKANYGDRAMSDHNPIFTTIWLGFKELKIYKLNQAGEAGGIQGNTTVLRITDSRDDLIELVGEGFMNDGPSQSDRLATVTIKNDNSVTDSLLLTYKGTLENGNFMWRNSSPSSGLKASEVVAFFQGKTANKPYRLKFQYGGCEIEIPFKIRSPTINTSGALTVSKPQQQILGSVNNTAKTSFACRKKNGVITLNETVYLRGSDFPTEQDVTIQLTGWAKPFIVQKSQIDEDGNFIVRLESACSLSQGARMFSATASIKDETIAKTEFEITREDMNDKKELFDKPGAFCRALSAITEPIKNVVNFFSFYGEVIDMVKVTDDNGCVKGLENLTKIAITVGIEYYTGGGASATKGGVAIAKTFIPKLGKASTNVFIKTIMTGAAKLGLKAVEEAGYIQLNGDIQEINRLLQSTSEPVVFLALSEEAGGGSSHGKMHIMAQQSLGLTRSTLNAALLPQTPVDKLRFSPKRVMLEAFNEEFRQNGCASLRAGQFIYDDNSRLLLIMQLDNNLVLYKINGELSVALGQSSTHNYAQELLFRMCMSTTNSQFPSYINSTGVTVVTASRGHIEPKREQAERFMFFPYEKSGAPQQLVLVPSDEGGDILIKDLKLGIVKGLVKDKLLNTPAQGASTMGIITTNGL